MDGWSPFSVLDCFDPDFAIRRFCPARVKQEQGAESGMQDTTLLYEEMELAAVSSPSTNPQLEEELHLVDSFLNLDNCYENESNKSSLEDYGTFDHPHREDDFYSDVPMLIEGDEQLESERCDSYDDPGVVSEMVPAVEDVSRGIHKGLDLVHKLLASAEAVGYRDTQLANSLLNQIWTSVCPWGNSLQRVAYCFAMGLKSRLSYLHNVKSNGIFTSAVTADVLMPSPEEKTEAFHLLHQTTPYITFGFMAANGAIYEAAKGKDLLHIIDLGMEHSLQWPSLIRSLASRKEGAPKLVRITGINEQVTGIELSTRGVIEEAGLVGVNVEFNIIAETVTSLILTKKNLKLRQGEVLFVNSIMNLHKHVKESRGSVKVILEAIKGLEPTLLTVVEQDANHNGPFFLGRFLESLHYYSAIFDALEASHPRDSLVRMKIEKFHFAEEILNIVAYEGSDRTERHERVDQWQRQIGRAGFQVEGLNCLSQVKTMLSVYGAGGYTVVSEKGCLLLGWKGRSMMLASAWRVHTATSAHNFDGPNNSLDRVRSNGA